MTMTLTRPGHNGRAGPTLADQLDRLDRILDGLAGALNESVAGAVTAAARLAAREALEASARHTSCAITAPAEQNRFVWTWASVQRGLATLGKTALGPLEAAFAGARRRLVWAPARCAGTALIGTAIGTAAGLLGPGAAAVLFGLVGTAVALLSAPLAEARDSSA